MPTTTLPNFALGGLSAGFLSAAARVAERDGRLSIDDPIASGEPMSIREYLASAPVWSDSGARLAQVIALRTGTPFAQLVARRILTPIGAHRTVVSSDGQVQSNVDELYRFELGLETNRTFGVDSALATDGSGDVRQQGNGLVPGWPSSAESGILRYAEYGTPAGTRNAFVRIPEQRTTIIILSNSDSVDARLLADRLYERLSRKR
jgi:CubicO group peptidase (beta-lactamase class C family)